MPELRLVDLSHNRIISIPEWLDFGEPTEYILSHNSISKNSSKSGIKKAKEKRSMSKVGRPTQVILFFGFLFEIFFGGGGFVEFFLPLCDFSEKFLRIIKNK